MGDLSSGVIVISPVPVPRPRVRARRCVRCPSMPKLLHRSFRSLSTSVSLTHFWHLMRRQDKTSKDATRLMYI